MRVSLDKAGEIVAENSKILKSEVLPLEECLGGVLAEDVIAAMSQPPFRRSAMDGYAVRREDMKGAFGQGDLVFKVVCEVDAGETGELRVGACEAVRIMTGARVPEGADMVIPQEESDMGEDYVTFRSVPYVCNIAPVGEDFRMGDVIAERGQRVDAYLLACAAASGIMELKIFRKPKVVIISTGDELCPAGEPLMPGKIYDSNNIYLSSRLRQFYCHVAGMEYVGDDPEKIIEAIRKGVLRGDMVITTGGVSVGKKDFLEQAVLGLHGNILFHGVDVKPGMPTMFSLVDGVPVLSLSGNPYSAGALFEWLFPFRSRLCTEGVLKGDFKRKRPCPRIVRGFYDGCFVEIAARQQNGVMQSGIGTNCLALLPAGDGALAAGSRVLLLLL